MGRGRKNSMPNNVRGDGVALQGPKSSPSNKKKLKEGQCFANIQIDGLKKSLDTGKT